MPEPTSKTEKGQAEPETAEDLAAATPPKADEDDEKLTVERLITDATAFGFTSADVAGAFHDVSRSREVSIKSAKERVRKWLRAPESKSDNEE